MARLGLPLRSRSKWKKAAFVVLSGGVLVQVGCPTIFAPLLLSLGESALFTILFGQVF